MRVKVTGGHQHEVSSVEGGDLVQVQTFRQGDHAGVDSLQPDTRKGSICYNSGEGSV